MNESDFQVFEAIGALVVVLNEAGEIVYWNQPCTDLTGYSLPEVRGRPFWDCLLVPDEANYVKAHIATLRHQPGPNPISHYWIAKVGRRRWITWSHAIVAGADMAGRYLIKTGIDSTAHREAEGRLQDDLAGRSVLAMENARLLEVAQQFAHDQREANQQMVRATLHAQELTELAETARASAAHSEAELKRVADFRDRFVGLLGHDLRNPLSAITLSAVMLFRNGNLDALAGRQVVRIIKSSQRMTRTISQLLDLTRARLGGGFPSKRELTDLSAVCNLVAEELGGSVEMHLEGGVTGFWDCDRLTEALLNVAAYAIEHATPETAVVIATRADGTNVVIEISGQGQAVPVESLPLIFDPFRRASDDGKSPPGNLGLYVAQQIVRAGGGTVEALSANGTNRFVIHLPRTFQGASPAEANPLARTERRRPYSDRRVGERRKRVATGTSSNS